MSAILIDECRKPTQGLSLYSETRPAYDATTAEADLSILKEAEEFWSNEGRLEYLLINDAGLRRWGCLTPGQLGRICLNYQVNFAPISLSQPESSEQSANFAVTWFILPPLLDALNLTLIVPPLQGAAWMEAQTTYEALLFRAAVVAYHESINAYCEI